MAAHPHTGAMHQAGGFWVVVTRLCPFSATDQFHDIGKLLKLLRFWFSHIQTGIIIDLRAPKDDSHGTLTVVAGTACPQVTTDLPA